MTSMNQVTKSKNVFIKGDYKVLAIIMASLFMAFIVSSFVIGFNRIVGKSMEPTFHENEWVLINKISYLNKCPQYDDIIVFRKKDVSSDILIKRVVAIPGDTIEIKNGVLIINNIVRKDSFFLENDECMEKISVKEGCYFVLGDNRDNSSDSRCWENPFVKEKDIIGKVMI